ncbi:MAG TPA: TIGR03087 family PEP-CTERM/XrtA system glycosyltransferase [Pirellulaceae bacterium]|nr:TIGR03087 family PEP-CTERM/XrtA system glycosyltransferase [Pirellulaceae bacterium]
MTSPQKKLLFLAHRAPYPPNRGDRIRTYHLLHHLAQEYQVYLGALLDEPLDDAGQAVLRDLTADMALVPLGKRSRWLRAAWSMASGRTATEGLFESPELRRQVRTWAGRNDFDAVFAFCSSMAPYAFVPELADVPLIVDLIDVDSQKWFDYADQAGGLKRQLFALEGRRVRKLERRIVDRAQAVTLVSQAEADLFRRLCPNDKTHAVPNGVDLDYFRPDFPVEMPRPEQCVFVGVLDYRANVESLVWFCREVWPLVRRQKPDAVFAIVGKNPVPAIRQLAAHSGIRLVGEVPDVRPYIAESRFSVAPLLVARGIQNKVLEAMAMGKPVVASPQALEGLLAQPGRDLLLAQAASEWLTAIDQLFAPSSTAADIGQSARRFAERTHRWDSNLAVASSLIGQPLPPLPSPLPALAGVA